MLGLALLMFYDSRGISLYFIILLVNHTFVLVGHLGCWLDDLASFSSKAISVMLRSVRGCRLLSPSVHMEAYYSLWSPSKRKVDPFKEGNPCWGECW
jgi:hypothetical protein